MSRAELTLVQQLYRSSSLAEGDTSTSLVSRTVAFVIHTGEASAVTN